MRLADADQLQKSWRANLHLQFERREARSVLAARRHDGPLVVQKALYPEGDAVCHAIIVHPPAGIAGGDELAIDIRACDGAHVLLTTPGAGKWYRTPGPWARQSVVIEARNEAIVEWLPQETIVFDGALADLSVDVNLLGDACYIGWEILCLGRKGSGEGFERGQCRFSNALRRDGRLAWRERGRIGPDTIVAKSRAGLGGCSVAGTMIAAATRIEDALLAACREASPRTGEGAVTRLPGALVARYLGDSGEAAREYFSALWSRIRPAFSGREAIAPRIWST
jgi:urease accessory protein